MKSSSRLAVALSLAGCATTLPALVPYSSARHTLEIPKGWKTTDEPDGSLRIDSPSGDVVLHASTLPVGESVDRATLAARGLRALGVEAAAPVSGTPAGVECARGTRLGNVVVLCLRTDVRGPSAVPAVVFQGTPDSWSSVGAELVPKMTLAFSAPPSPR